MEHPLYLSAFFPDWFITAKETGIRCHFRYAKTIMGFVILIAGANLIAATLTIFSQLFEHSFNIQGVVPNTDAMAALAQKTTVPKPR